MVFTTTSTNKNNENNETWIKCFDDTPLETH